MKESFVFYKSFLGAFELINKKRCWEFLKALCAYATDGEILPLSASEEAAMSLIRPQLDANRRRYENGKKGAEYGVLGGRPRKEKDTSEKTPNVNENENVNENVNVNAKKRPLSRIELLDAHTDRERFYADRRSEAERVAMRNEKLAMTVEGYAEAVAAVRMWQLDSVKRQMNGEVVDPLEEEVLKSRVRQLLKKVNLTEYDLEPHYTCKECNDTGWRLEDGLLCDCYDG